MSDRTGIIVINIDKHYCAAQAAFEQGKYIILKKTSLVFATSQDTPSK